MARAALRTAKALWRVIGNPNTKLKLASPALKRASRNSTSNSRKRFCSRASTHQLKSQNCSRSAAFRKKKTLRSVYALYCAGLITRIGYTAALKVAAQSAPSPSTATASPQIDQTERQDIIRMAQLVVESNDDYEILGLTPQTTQVEVKRTYHRLAKKYHPTAINRMQRGDHRLPEQYLCACQASLRSDQR